VSVSCSELEKIVAVFGWTTERLKIAKMIDPTHLIMILCVLTLKMWIIRVREHLAGLHWLKMSRNGVAEIFVDESNGPELSLKKHGRWTSYYNIMDIVLGLLIGGTHFNLQMLKFGVAATSNNCCKSRHIL
jgi:hypothetical protein